jgi:hypothetical protein
MTSSDVQRTERNTVAARYTPHAHQRRFHAAAGRFAALVAGRRYGKTYAAAAETVTRVYATLAEDLLAAGRVRSPAGGPPIFLREPRRSYWVVGPHYRLVEAARRYVFALLPRSEWAVIAQGKRAGWSAKDRTLWLEPDIAVSFRTADDPLQLVSEGLDGVWLTEAARLKPEAWQILRPALADRAGWAIADTTPLGENWFFVEWWQRGDPQSDRYDPAHTNHHGYSDDNPHLPREELDYLRRTLSPRYYEREMRASFSAWHGRVWDEWEPRVHVVAGPAPLPGAFRRVVAGVDYGAVSPGAIIVVGLRGDDTAMVIREEYAAGRPLATWVESARRIRDECGVRMFWVDPSAAGLAQSLRLAGLPAKPADNDVTLGLQTVAMALHHEPANGAAAVAPRLTIHASCANLIREVASYRWHEHRVHGMVEEPAPGQSDHACDALRYALTSEAGGDPYHGAFRSGARPRAT